MRLAELQRRNKGYGEAILKEELLYKLGGTVRKAGKKHECEVRGYWQSC